MLWVPEESALVEQAALGALPPPLSATAEQPAMELAPSVKLTVPVGEDPRTVAVMLTPAPAAAGLEELVKLVLLAGKPEAATPQASTSVSLE